MTAIKPIIRRMTFEEADQAGLYERGFILEHQCHSYQLNAGTSDIIHPFTRSVVLFVLTINRGLGYIGLDAYMPMEPEPINTIFLHSEQAIVGALGPKWTSMKPVSIATKLIDYLY